MEKTNSPLYDRLLEVCRDEGVENPRGADICRVARLTSGRVSQIRGASGSAQLSAETLTILNKKGYRTQWLTEGRGPKKEGDPPATDEDASLSTATDDERRLLLMFRGVPPAHQEFVIQSIGVLFDLFSEYPKQAKDALLFKGRDDAVVAGFAARKRVQEKVK